MKKFLSVVLAMVMMLSLAATAGAANTYNDMPAGWSHDAMQAAVDNGIMSGNEKGQLMPKGTVTRAQAATMLVNALGGTVKADISKFTDVKSGDWFYEKMAVAVNMGLFAGTGSKLEPNKALTREQAAVVISSALWLMDKTADMSKFADSAKISAWAKDGVAEMVKAGYMSGSGSMINPQSSITREEFAQILYSVVEKYISQTGTYKDTVDGNLVVRGKDVTLDGATVKGDLIVGDGAGDSTITVKNTTIGGRVVVRGGGANSVVFTNTKLGTVVVARPDGAVRVSTDAASTPAEVFAEAGKQEIILTGSLSEVKIETATPVIFDKATVESVSVSVPKADVTVSDNTTVKAVTVTKDAAGAEVSVETSSKVGTVTTAASDSTVAVDKTATVSAVTADGSGTKITGDGTVEKVTASAVATNTTVTTPNTNVVNNSATPIETSSGTVPSGQTGTTNDSGAINSGSSTGGGGAVTPVQTYKMTITITNDADSSKTATASVSNLTGTTSFYAQAKAMYLDKTNYAKLQSAFGGDSDAKAMADAGCQVSSSADFNNFITAYSGRISDFTGSITSYDVTIAQLLKQPALHYSYVGYNYTMNITITAA